MNSLDTEGGQFCHGQISVCRPSTPLWFHLNVNNKSQDIQELKLLSFSDPLNVYHAEENTSGPRNDCLKLLRRGWPPGKILVYVFTG